MFDISGVYFWQNVHKTWKHFDQHLSNANGYKDERRNIRIAKVSFMVRTTGEFEETNLYIRWLALFVYAGIQLMGV